LPLLARACSRASSASSTAMRCISRAIVWRALSAKGPSPSAATVSISPILRRARYSAANARSRLRSSVRVIEPPPGDGRARPSNRTPRFCARAKRAPIPKAAVKIVSVQQVGQDHCLAGHQACRPPAKPSIAQAHALRPYDSCGCDVPQRPWLRAGNGQTAARQRVEPPRNLAAGLGIAADPGAARPAGRISVAAAFAGTKIEPAAQSVLCGTWGPHGLRGDPRSGHSRSC